jgi:hypothetical protein
MGSHLSECLILSIFRLFLIYKVSCVSATTTTLETYFNVMANLFGEREIEREKGRAREEKEKEDFKLR